MRHAWLVAATIASLCSCTGTTGYELVSFYAAAQGPADASAGRPYTFTSGAFEITLTKALIHVGALYLNQSLPTSGSAEGRCTLPGTYVGEVRAGRDIDMLDPSRQLFPEAGEGSTIPAAVGQVWLTGGDVFSLTDVTKVLSIAGTAREGQRSIPFSGDITIDQSRSPAATGSALPGANPICEQRIVTPIVAAIALRQSGTLVLRLDPKGLFTNVDFAALPQVGSNPPAFAFTNDATNTPSVNLYANLRAAGSVYRLEFIPSTP